MSKAVKTSDQMNQTHSKPYIFWASCFTSSSSSHFSPVSKDHSQQHGHHRPRGRRGRRGRRPRRRCLATHHAWRGAGHPRRHEGQRGRQQDGHEDGPTCHGEDGEARTGRTGRDCESGNCGDGWRLWIRLWEFGWGLEGGWDVLWFLELEGSCEHLRTETGRIYDGLNTCQRAKTNMFRQDGFEWSGRTD